MVSKPSDSTTWYRPHKLFNSQEFEVIAITAECFRTKENQT